MAILVFILLLFSALANEEILFVASILRHGARNMIFGNHNLTNDTEFLRNPGKLTDVGRHQLYLLGRQLAQDYIKTRKFLTPYYDPNTIIVRTSGLNRTIESVQALLSGMYPAGTGPSLKKLQEERAVPPIEVADKEKIIEELAGGALSAYVQYLPIHTANEYKDYLFSPHTECKTVSTENKDNKEKFDEINKQYTKLYEAIKKESNITVNSIEDVYNLYNDMTTVEGNAVYKKINFTPDIVLRIQELVEKHGRMIMIYSDTKAKLLGHAALFDTMKYFIKTKEQAKSGALPKDYLKLAIFHLSDIHILAISKLLNLKIMNESSNKDVPVDIPYASFLRFELYRNGDSNNDDAYNVRVIYNNNTTTINSQNSKSFNDFIELLKKNTYENEEKFFKICFVGEIEKSNSSILLFVLIPVLIGVIIICGVVLIVVIIRRKRANKFQELDSVEVQPTHEEEYNGEPVNYSLKDKHNH